MMIDWISGFIQLRPEVPQVPFYDTGEWLKLSPGGEVESKRAGHLTHEGSFDSNLLVKSSTGMDLYLSGNPVKHIQGHNLYGPDDAIGLFFDAGLVVRKALGLFPSPQTFKQFYGPRFTRLDLTRSYRFDSSTQANAWLRDVAAFARTRHGAPVMRGGTVYYGKGSEYWTFKIYNKGDEVQSRKKGHELHPHLRNRRQLLEWSEGVVRFELTLKSKELQRIDARSTPLQIWEFYHSKIDWNQNAMLTQNTAITEAIEKNLPTRLQAAVKLWRHGEDLREVYSKSAFYRYRKDIKDAIGVDISSKPAVEKVSTVQTSLKPSGWDPEPLESYPHDIEKSKQPYLV